LIIAFISGESSGPPKEVDFCGREFSSTPKYFRADITFWSPNFPARAFKSLGWMLDKDNEEVMALHAGLTLTVDTRRSNSVGSDDEGCFRSILGLAHGPQAGEFLWAARLG
jgi:hypothetical protein